jgi:hypothetical protein
MYLVLPDEDGARSMGQAVPLERDRHVGVQRVPNMGEVLVGHGTELDHVAHGLDLIERVLATGD